MRDLNATSLGLQIRMNEPLVPVCRSLISVAWFSFVLFQLFLQKGGGTFCRTPQFRHRVTWKSAAMPQKKGAGPSVYSDKGTKGGRERS